MTQKKIIETHGVAAGHSRAMGEGYAFDVLSMPSDPGLLEALGRLAIAHTQLELMLRYMVKTLSGLSVADALDATSQDRMSDLRERIKRLFKEQKPTERDNCQLLALLHQAKDRSEKRNEYLHSAWSTTNDGQALMKGERHAWGPAPTPHDVEALAGEIVALCKQLNEARLRGFISKVVARRNLSGAAPVARSIPPA